MFYQHAGIKSSAQLLVNYFYIQQTLRVISIQVDSSLCPTAKYESNIYFGFSFVFVVLTALIHQLIVNMVSVVTCWPVSVINTTTNTTMNTKTWEGLSGILNFGYESFLLLFLFFPASLQLQYLIYGISLSLPAPNSLITSYYTVHLLSTSEALELSGPAMVGETA